LSPQSLPIIDISALVAGESSEHIAAELGQACREQGFFYVVGHGVSLALQEQLEHLSREFFAFDLETKMAIRMELGGRAWRGYFPIEHELTAGVPDIKEGLYFGTELPDDDPRVVTNKPLHGRNLFPEFDHFRETVLAYIDALTQLGHTLMRGLALSLGLQINYFDRHYTADPTILFRIFHYPTSVRQGQAAWGVGEHTDYGLLTILRQDRYSGLQVKSGSSWINAPPVPNTFVCNIGDMLDRMSGGLYRSTPHRVRNESHHGRLSFPFFFDPDMNADIKPIFPARPPVARWDGTNLQELSGTYGDYLLGKIAKVFPDLTDRL